MAEESESLRKEAASQKQELQKKVNQLTQVTTMKKLLQDKNSQIATLRSRLAKYEPLNPDDDDDGGDQV